MNEMTHDILQALQPAFLMLIEGTMAALVPLLLWKLNAWAKAKVHDARFHCAMDKVTTTVEAAVLDVSQTYVKGVRKSGKWDGDAATEAKSRALSRARELLGPAGIKELKGCLGHDDDGVSKLLGSEVERSLSKLKKDGHTLPSGGARPVQPEGASEK